VKILSTQAMRLLLRRSASWFDLPRHGAKPWPLSTHQGRKTFVRFAALRDRSALFALAQHLGHRERGITDYCYAGTDYVLNREIDAAILEQSVSTWEQMLSAPALGGRAGAEILAKRPRFRGTRVKQDLKRYARMLVDAGLTLGVCDWGFCVYRQEHSACLGSTSAPNPVRREPSTCARCRNFVVGPQHRGIGKRKPSDTRLCLTNRRYPRRRLRSRANAWAKRSRWCARSIEQPKRPTMPVADRPNRCPGASAAPVAERLHEALAVMSNSGSAAGPRNRTTVAELCRRAGVSRNTLYRYYPDVLEAVRLLHRQQQPTTAEASAARRDLRPEINSLRSQLSKLAALVDHYYAAYRETLALLERRDREVAELRRGLKSSPTQLRR
jgi:Bacterial regulatory proteins, tetR family